MCPNAATVWESEDWQRGMERASSSTMMAVEGKAAHRREREMDVWRVSSRVGSMVSSSGLLLSASPLADCDVVAETGGGFRNAGSEATSLRRHPSATESPFCRAWRAMEYPSGEVAEDISQTFGDGEDMLLAEDDNRMRLLCYCGWWLDAFTGLVATLTLDVEMGWGIDLF